ncbi:hypothetical protein FAGKG844_110079 [Frankia sp. AgKG'84/4]
MAATLAAIHCRLLTMAERWEGTDPHLDLDLRSTSARIRYDRRHDELRSALVRRHT